MDNTGGVFLSSVKLCGWNEDQLGEFVIRKWQLIYLLLVAVGHRTAIVSSHDVNARFDRYITNKVHHFSLFE
jgi:hypothetical protein